MLLTLAEISTKPLCWVIQVPLSGSPGAARNGDIAGPSMKTFANEAMSSVLLPPTVPNDQPPGDVVPVDVTGPLGDAVPGVDTAAPGVAAASALAKTICVR